MSPWRILSVLAVALLLAACTIRTAPADEPDASWQRLGFDAHATRVAVNGADCVVVVRGVGVAVDCDWGQS